MYSQVGDAADAAGLPTYGRARLIYAARVRCQPARRRRSGKLGRFSGTVKQIGEPERGEMVRLIVLHHIWKFPLRAGDPS